MRQQINRGVNTNINKCSSKLKHAKLYHNLEINERLHFVLIDIIFGPFNGISTYLLCESFISYYYYSTLILDFGSFSSLYFLTRVNRIN